MLSLTMPKISFLTQIKSKILYLQQMMLTYDKNCLKLEIMCLLHIWILFNQVLLSTYYFFLANLMSCIHIHIHTVSHGANEIKTRTS